MTDYLMSFDIMKEMATRVCAATSHGRIRPRIQQSSNTG